MVRREVRGHVEDRGRQGSIEAFDRAPGPPDAPLAPIPPWTRAFGPSPIRVQETRARSRKVRSTLIWKIPVHSALAGMAGCGRSRWKPSSSRQTPGLRGTIRRRGILPSPSEPSRGW